MNETLSNQRELLSDLVEDQNSSYKQALLKKPVPSALKNNNQLLSRPISKVEVLNGNTGPRPRPCPLGPGQGGARVKSQTHSVTNNVDSNKLKNNVDSDGFIKVQYLRGVKKN